MQMPITFTSGLTHVDAPNRFALVELQPDGFSIELDSLSATWGVLITILDRGGPANFSRTYLERALRMVDRIHLVPRGQGFVDGKCVGNPSVEFQADYLREMFVALMSGRRSLTIAPNPSRLSEWRAVLHFLAPSVPITTWAPEAIAA